ncbi:MAG TPA: NAD(P)/FAD-dependent oxidoreductase [Acidimicrobiia bacterium]|nr:NAD(P)/FAD-dependent oxidoreductase [Acidimicrobiia bacterium]
MTDFDAAVVGAGPNGLAAAVELARSGRKTLLVEASQEIGGGTRTAELTLPGFKHDICSAIHPSGVASPFFTEIGLEVDWVQSPIPFTHPLEDGRVTALHRSVDETALGVGEDGPAYRSLMGPIVENIAEMVDVALGPVTVIPEHKGAFARIALIGGLPAAVLAKRFATDEGKALIAGVSAHAIAPFHAPATAAVGVMLGAIGHSHGWPMARGGSQTITGALAARFLELGGEIEVGREISSVEELPARLVFLDVMPPTAHAIARSRISSSTSRKLSRWKPGPGIFKIDWALDGPIPWKDPLSAQAATVHLGGRYAEVAAAERAVSRGEHPKRPFVLLAQQSLFDDTRAPAGKHTAWSYCHVPNGSTVDMTEAIESQIERFAPGFRDLILERSTRGAMDFQKYNPNYIGGDIGGGRYGLRKVLQVGNKAPYDLGGDVYLCSSATPPGAGVHGMSGYHAVRAAIG